MEDSVDKENLIYFDHYCISRGAAISFYVERLINTTVNENEREYLLSNIKAYVEEMTDVSKKNRIKKHNINLFDNYLYLLKNQNIDFINNYLNDIKYYEEIEISKLTIFNKIKLNVLLNQEELTFIELLIKYNKIKESDKIFIYEYFIKLLIERESYNYIVSYDIFKDLIKDYVKKLMKVFVKDPICVICSKKDLNGRDGSSYLNVINIKENDIKNFYDSGDIGLLSTIYHELYHVKRYKEINVEKKCNLLILKEIKDDILSRLIDGYYMENYKNISFEVGADCFSLKMLLDKLESFNIPIINYKEIENKFDEYRSRINSDTRLINNEVFNINELFKEKIKDNMEYLEIYPQLATLLERGNSK